MTRSEFLKHLVCEANQISIDSLHTGARSSDVSLARLKYCWLAHGYGFLEEEIQSELGEQYGEFYLRVASRAINKKLMASYNPFYFFKLRRIHNLLSQFYPTTKEGVIQ